MGRTVGFLYRSAAPALLLLLTLTAGTATAAFAATVELVSKADPVPDSFGASFSSGMSADGRYVLFQSVAPNLVSGQVDTNGFYDLFLRDRVAGTTTLISHAAAKPNVAGHSAEQFDPNYYFADASLSADGRYVAFISFWTDLVPDPAGTNASGDVYLWDRVTGTTTLISHAAGDPAATADGFAIGVRISADGNYVVFSSSADNLLAGQTPSAAGMKFNLFLYQRSSGSLTLISHPSGAPAMGANGDSDVAEISADGGSVAFVSQASDLIPGLAGSQQNIFLYQRATGAITLVSHAAGAPLGSPNGGSSRVRVSADGRYVAFISAATNLLAGQVPPALSNAVSAFLYDKTTGALRLVSHTTASPLTPAISGLVELSADGRYAVFNSLSPDVIPGQANLSSGNNVFLYDRVANTTSLVSHNRDSATTTPSSSGAGAVSLSADGRYIAYQDIAVDLVPHQTDTPSTSDIFVYDRVAGTTVLASHLRTSLSTAANGGSVSARISADGSVVAFGSYATDLAAGRVDPNGFQDLYLFDRKSAEVTDLSPRAPDLPAVTPIGPSSAADLSADGRTVVFASEAAGLVAGQVDTPYSIDPYGQTRGTWDVFLRDRATGKTTLLSRSKASPPTATGGFFPALSADGLFAAFTAPDHDPNGQSLGRLDVYDRAADALILANHLPGTAAQPDGLPYGRPALSADGRYVAYTCSRCHLVSGQQDGRPDFGNSFDVFLYDRVTGTNTLVSHASGLATTTGDADSQAPRISADGRFVLFTSGATDLAAGQTGPQSPANVFVFDRTTGAVTLVNHAAGSAAGASGPAYDAALSADGRWIAYRSAATDLVPGQVDTNGVFDVFLYDRTSGVTALVSHASSSPVTAGSTTLDYYGGDVPVSLSADGRWIVFTSQATDLVPGGVNPSQTVAVYLYDRTTGGVSLVSSAAGSPNAARYGREPGISADGSRITFLSNGTDLVPGQGAGTSTNLFVQERATGARTLAGRVLEKSYYPDGISTNVSFVSRLSADGRVVAFTSDSSLVAGDFNQTWDAFVFDATAPQGPVTVPPCALFSGVLRSNVRRALTAAGACGVPAGAKQVLIKLTASQGTGKGNVRLYPGNVTATPSGILRFTRGATQSSNFTQPLGNGAFALLPFVAGNGTVRVSVEVDGYVP